MTVTRSFNPPPNWPEPPHDGWIPPTDFVPDQRWGPVPAGWRLWTREDRAGGPAPLQASEDVPASGARPRPRVEQYPVAVLNPGIWTENHPGNEDYGFPEPTPRPDRPRVRLGVTIAVTVLGFLIAAATAVMFVMLVNFAVEDLLGVLEKRAAGHLTGSFTPADGFLADVLTAAIRGDG
ncbi:hypothetical protein [Brachybacterium sp. UMB0905]|uniref:hypothetical protein n=1 Tax=Brachybacterium sp. UMB0905 TaxID=2069310 RepID=UPI001E53D6FF|nr:hypothetical protein [Brachybacterium sp. UMB0905]